MSSVTAMSPVQVDARDRRGAARAGGPCVEELPRRLYNSLRARAAEGSDALARGVAYEGLLTV